MKPTNRALASCFPEENAFIDMHSREIRHSRINRSESPIHDEQHIDMSKRIQKSQLWRIHAPVATTDSEQCVLSPSSVNL
ncbi:hypothetical protein V8C37DRAFT_391056 [Trichoderma ceciliae]